VSIQRHFTDEEHFFILTVKANRVTLVNQEGHLIGVWTGPMRSFRARMWAWLHGYNVVNRKDYYG
jgi:hypothetical protein